MLDFSIPELTIISLVVLIGSASQAAIGMGLNLLAIPILLLINPVYAPGPIFAVSCALSFLSLRRVPSKINRDEFKYSFFGLIIGTAIASVVVSNIDTSNLTRLLGGFIVLGVGLALSGWSASLSNRNLTIAGSSAGFIGTIAGVHAPPIALLYQGLSPNRVRGAILMFLGVGNGLSLLALIAVGQFGKNQVVATALLVPAVLAGLWAAPALARRLDARVLRLSVLSISAISGLALLF